MGKYEPLRMFLAGQTADVELTFARISRLVGGLPPSSSRHRAWWANDASHVQARAWLQAGRRVAAVDLGARRVRFS